MKFKSVNEFDEIKLGDTQLSELKLTEDQMVLHVDGAVIKSGNSQNSRFEDMYSMDLEMVLSGVRVMDFCRQGFRYYDADGNLINAVADRSLTSKERESVLLAAAGAYLFSVERCGDEPGSCVLIFDIENENEDTETYQIEFAFEECVARWDRYSGPVNER